jgi:coproporphyrinogen III oxidase-like Fe-S oxidoreductase
VERDGDGLTADEPVAPEERAREALLMGLRLTEGIDLARFAARTGRTMAQSVDAAVLAQCIEEQYLVLTPDRLVATRDGRIRLDSLLASLVA